MHHDIPEEVLQAADTLRHWAIKNAHHDWELGGVCDRSFVDKQRQTATLAGELIAAFKINTLHHKLVPENYRMVEAMLKPYENLLASMTVYPTNS